MEVWMLSRMSRMRVGIQWGFAVLVVVVAAAGFEKVSHE
jgi:hypothetical protein